jgi:anti-sigma factor RsiW
MNPDKLFDYLDGRLSPAERVALEQRLASDTQLQRELAIAREIHARMQGDSREVVLPAEDEISERGRKLARRVGVAFIILMAANVGAGLWFIAHHESKNPNRALLEAQMRQQLAQSLEHAAVGALSPAPLGVTEIKLSTTPGRLEAVGNEVADIVRQLGGTTTKGIPEEHRLGLLVDLPPNRAAEFWRKVAAITGATIVSPAPNEMTASEAETKSFAVEIVESTVSPR